MLLTEAKVTSPHELSEVGLFLLEHQKNIVKIRLICSRGHNNVKKFWKKATVLIFGNFFESSHNLNFSNEFAAIVITLLEP